MCCMRGGSGKEFFFVADAEELKHLDASEIHARRFNTKEVLMPKERGFVLRFADEISQIGRKRSGFSKIHFNSGSQCAT